MYTENEWLLILCKNWLGLKAYECFDIEQWPPHLCSLIDELITRVQQTGRAGDELERVLKGTEYDTYAEDVEYNLRSGDFESDLNTIRHTLEDLREIISGLIEDYIMKYVPMVEEFPHQDWALRNIESWCTIEG